MTSASQVTRAECLGANAVQCWSMSKQLPTNGSGVSAVCCFPSCLVLTIHPIPCPRLACHGVYSPRSYSAHAFTLVQFPSITSQRILVRFSSPAKILHPIIKRHRAVTARTTILFISTSCLTTTQVISNLWQSTQAWSLLSPRSAKPVRGTAKPPLRNYPRTHHHSRQSTRRRTTCCLQGSIARHLSKHPRIIQSRDQQPVRQRRPWNNTTSPERFVLT